MGGVCFINFLLFSLIFSKCFILQSSSASTSPKQHLSSAMVEGFVYCNTCFQQDFHNFGHFIPGHNSFTNSASTPDTLVALLSTLADALVAVNCVEGLGQNKLQFQKKVKTNKHGMFRFRLPLVVSRNLEEALKTSCSVKLVRSSKSFCSMASSSSETSSSLRLKSKRHSSLRVFSAGVFYFKPIKQPDSCYNEPILSRNRVKPALFFPPPIPFLPPPSIPFLPSPSIPFLPSPPNVGGIPLPPNPLQPPPSILPPLPFQPPPPPFFGIPPLPNIPPLPTIPPIPFLAPPPPPPPPPFIPQLPFPPLNPTLPFPPMFPPLPLPPISPGNPPPAAFP